MIRLILVNLLLFLLPTILYVIYASLRRGDTEDGSFTRVLNSAPFPILISVGLVLMVSVLAFYASDQKEGSKPGQRYVPPTVVDGKVQPGRFE